MQTNANDWTSLLGRIETLERQNRRLRRVGGLAALALAALLGTGVACGPGQPQGAGGVVEAQDFVLRNEAGEVAGRFYVDDRGEPRLTLFSRPDEPGVQLWTNAYRAKATLLNNGKRKVEMDAESEAEISRFTFYNSEGRVKMQTITESGLSSISLRGASNEKGVESNIVMYMPPEGYRPQFKMRTVNMEERVWTVE